jgi:hypothetical protein
MKRTDHPSLRQFAHRVRGAIATASGVELLQAVPLIERPLRYLERHPVMHGVVLSAFGLRHPIFIDHPVRPQPRPEHPGIRDLVERGRGRYAHRLGRFRELDEYLAAIPLRDDPDGTGPYWVNGWLPPLDALALYGFVTQGAPKRYVEVGSGNSTKFVRRAISDHRLPTHITSIDPHPRAAVDKLCDTVVRVPLEDSDPGLFADLEPGDIVFLDGSHRVLMGSDVTVFFFEILPRLRPGVLVHIHDIYLPRDYPPQWRWRHYSEQYLLAAFLLADPQRFDIELPAAYIEDDAALGSIVAPFWDRIGVPVGHPAASFWLRITGSATPANRRG